MARRPNYSFERRERERKKTEKRQARLEEKAERVKARKLKDQDPSAVAEGEATPEDSVPPASE
jgi:hypothetical protein